MCILCLAVTPQYYPAGKVSTNADLGTPHTMPDEFEEGAFTLKAHPLYQNVDKVFKVHTTVIISGRAARCILEPTH